MSGLPTENTFTGAFDENGDQFKFQKRWKSPGTVPLQHVHIEAKFKLKNRAPHLSALTQTPMKKTDKIRLQKASTEEKSSY